MNLYEHMMSESHKFSKKKVVKEESVDTAFDELEDDGTTELKEVSLKESKVSRDNYAVKQITFDVIVPGDEDLAVGPDGKFYNALYRACKDAGYVIASDSYGWESEDITDLYNEIGVVDEILDELEEGCGDSNESKKLRESYNEEYGTDIGKFRKFSQDDWDAYAGAETITIKEVELDPLIYSNDYADIIISGNNGQFSVEIDVENFEDEDEDHIFIVDNISSMSEAIEVGNEVIDYVNLPYDEAIDILSDKYEEFSY